LNLTYIGVNFFVLRQLGGASWGTVWTSVAREAAVWGLSLIVIPTGRDLKLIGFGFAGYSVYKPMFTSDPARPPPLQIVFQGLRLTETSKRVAFNIFDEFVDRLKDLRVSGLPVQVVFPSPIGPEKLHGSMRSRLVPPPPSS